jgi:hypothetical protein
VQLVHLDAANRMEHALLERHHVLVRDAERLVQVADVHDGVAVAHAEEATWRPVGRGRVRSA